MIYQVSPNQSFINPVVLMLNKQWTRRFITLRRGAIILGSPIALVGDLIFNFQEPHIVMLRFNMNIQIKEY